MISVCHVYQEHTTPNENNDTATASEKQWLCAS
jgi:hypothetical protein